MSPANATAVFDDGDPPLPARIDRFRIEERIGGGSFGIVYRAHDPESGRDVAVKVIQVTTERARRRYVAECEALQTLAGDTFAWCPRFVAAGSGDVTAWIAMELIEGGAIDEYCDAERLDLYARLRLFRTACLGVESAHNRGILHLDLKPEHVLVQKAAAPDGGTAPRLIDLGLARGLYFTLGPGGSTHGEGRGTPGYMGPEITDGRMGDPRSDVYSLGAVLYLLLSGCRPRDRAKTGEYAGQTPPHRVRELLPSPDARFAELLRRDAAAAAAIPATRAVPAKALLAFLRGDAGRIVMRALHPEPDRRYQSPAELADDLGRFLEHRPIATRSNRLYRARLFLQRNRRWLGVLAGAAAAVLAVILLLDQNLAQAEANVRLSRERQRAVAESLLHGGETAAQRGNWSQALALYDEAERVADRGQGVLSLELGIRRVEALEASYQVDAAHALLAELRQRSDAATRLAKLLLLECDLGVVRLEQPDANLDLARRVMGLVEQDERSLAPVEVEFARSLLAATPQEALACLRRARVLDASNYRVNMHYAMALLLLGEREEALRFAAVVQALSPQDEEAHYLSIAMTAMGANTPPETLAEAVRAVRAQFGDEAGDVAEGIVDVLTLLPWGNQRMRDLMTKQEMTWSTVVATFAALSSKPLNLARALAERKASLGERGRSGELLRVPPAIARAYKPLLSAVTQRPMRPQVIAAALRTLRPGEHDGFMLFLGTMGLVFDQQFVSAVHRVDEVMRAKSSWLEPRTVLLFGCMLGTRVVLEDAVVPADVRPKVVSWLREAARRDDWSPAEMIVLFDRAYLIGEHELAIGMAHTFHSIAPSDPGVTAAYVQTLLMHGAAAKADAVLKDIEPGLARLPEATKGRVVALRGAIDKVLKK